MRHIETGNEGISCVEIENVVAEFPKGKLFGEIALLEPAKATRVLSAMTKTDCIFIILNQEAFDIMIKEKLKREKEELGKFVYNTLPKIKENFSLYAVSSNVHLLFKESVKTIGLINFYRTILKVNGYNKRAKLRIKYI